MSYQTTSTKSRTDVKARAGQETTPNTAMPFVFGLRRRALKQMERIRDEIDPAVGSQSTD